MVPELPRNSLHEDFKALCHFFANSRSWNCDKAKIDILSALPGIRFSGRHWGRAAICHDLARSTMIGCWTCRLRRKKCPGEQPNCSTCTLLSVACYGYGYKPDWMDGGSREKEKLEEIKKSVKQITDSQRKTRALLGLRLVSGIWMSIVMIGSWQVMSTASFYRCGYGVFTGIAWSCSKICQLWV